MSNNTRPVYVSVLVNKIGLVVKNLIDEFKRFPEHIFNVTGNLDVITMQLINLYNRDLVNENNIQDFVNGLILLNSNRDLKDIGLYTDLIKLLNTLNDELVKESSLTFKKSDK